MASVEDALQTVWLSSYLNYPERQLPPLRFDVNCLDGMLDLRRRWHMDMGVYLRAMGEICRVSVAAPENYRRRVVLFGVPEDMRASHPQLAVSLAQTEKGEMMDCAVSLTPETPEGQLATEHQLARIPLALFEADRAGTLTTDFMETSRMSAVRRVAGAVGSVMQMAAGV